MQNISLLPIDAQLRISIGAGNQAWPGWIATQGNELNLLRRDQWETIFGDRRIDALHSQHRRAEGPFRGRCVELAGPRARGIGVHGR